MGPETGAEVPAPSVYIYSVGRESLGGIAQCFSMEPGLMNGPAPHSVTVLQSTASVLY